MQKSKNLFYSSGSLSAALTGATFSTYIIFYYVDVLKIPAELIGLGMAIYGIWNAINDPLLGHMSDRTRSKWGRRIPYIRFGSLPFVLAFMLVWAPPVKLLSNNANLIFAYFMLAIFLYDTLFTLVIINWTSLFPEMYKTQEERTSVSAMRQIFGIVGNILGVAAPPILYATVGWSSMGIIFGIITFIFLILSLVGAKEDPSYSEGEGLSMLESLKATFSNKSFLTYVIGSMFVQFTFVMLQAGIPFYAKYVLKIEGFSVSLLMGTIFIVALFFVNLWGKIANSKGSKTTIIISAMLYGIALIPFWFVKSLAGGIITTGILGIGLAGLIVLLDVLLSDIIDEDELKTGTRREGIYFGINGFMIRLGISAQSIIMGTILKLSGYNAHLSVNAQPASAIIGIKSLITIIPIIAITFAILFYKMYPLYGDRLNEVKEKIKLLHVKDNAATIDSNDV